MAKEATKLAEESSRPKRGRSPAYPGIDLEAALGKAKAFFEVHGKYSAPMPLAFEAWGFGAKSSGGRETRSALRYFGLITVEGDGETGKVKLTDKALRVILDEREDRSEKLALIREFALMPAVHKRLLEQFPEGIKSDANAEHFLMFDEGYNKSAATEVVTEFKATASYAGLYKPANVVVKPENGGEQNPPPVLEVGDLIQVEIGGAFQLEKPKRVRAMREADGRQWVFIEGSETGIPMEQAQIVEKGAGTPPSQAADAPRLPIEPQVEWREERLLDEAGDEIFIKYKGAPSKERYEFIRDYLDFKVKRLK